MALVRLSTLLRGIVLGFCASAPVGPVGLLCIRRTLASGMSAGIFSGLGAALADSLYGCVAAFGISAVSGFLLRNRNAFRLAGGIFLCCFGLCMMHARRDRNDVGRPPSSGGLFISTFVLTASNPLTVLSFVAIFSGLGFHPSCPFTLATGVFIGSVLWWSLLSGGVSLFRRRMSPTVFTWIDLISGGVIAAFGIALVGAAAWRML